MKEDVYVCVLCLGIMEIVEEGRGVRVFVCVCVLRARAPACVTHRNQDGDEFLL